MAAGRNGGYRDNEFKERESDLVVSRRNFTYPKDEYDRSRNGNREGRIRDSRERGRVRQKDIKERESINGGYRSSSSRSDSGSSGGGPRRCGFSVRTADREPGELSSESGSDEAIESESQANNEVSKVENGIQSPLNRKRKFSPIVWDREDKELNSSSKSRIASTATALPPPPPLPKTYRQSPKLIPDEGMRISPTKNSKIQRSQLPPTPSLPPVAPLSASLDVSSSPLIEVSASSPQEQQWAKEKEAEQIEDEDYVPTRNISSSRWADEANSPVDEGEILDDEEIPKRRKKMFLSEGLESRVHKKSVSPELGELKREGSEGSRVKSTDSDERGNRVRSGSREDYPDNDSDRNDYMDVEDYHNDDASARQSDTDSEQENVSRETPEPVLPPQRSVNMLQGCRSVDEFERLNKIDEGTYGVVYRAKDKKTGEVVALKKVKMEKEREGFPMTSLREINILLSFHNPSIVDVKEVVVGSNLDSIFMVMEYMEHDLKALMETMKQPFSQSEVKCLMLQLLEGIKYLHDNWVLHRDLKTSNLLLNNRGELKICDFGLARQYGSPLKPYTHLVVTLWYR